MSADAEEKKEISSTCSNSSTWLEQPNVFFLFLLRNVGRYSWKNTSARWS